MRPKTLNKATLPQLKEMLHAEREKIKHEKDRLIVESQRGLPQSALEVFRGTIAVHEQECREIEAHIKFTLQEGFKA